MENSAGARFCNFCGSQLDASAPRDRRKIVTILFVDLKLSASANKQITAELAHVITSRYFGITKAIVESHGGVVDKFVGDPVLAVFRIRSSMKTMQSEQSRRQH